MRFNKITKMITMLTAAAAVALSVPAEDVLAEETVASVYTNEPVSAAQAATRPIAVMMPTDAVAQPSYGISHAKILYDAINKVDWYDPAVDDRIKQFLKTTRSVRNTYLPSNRMILNEIENQENISPKTNREDRKKEIENIITTSNKMEISRIENDRATGLADVQGKDFDGNEPIYDKSNRRWLKCTNCEKLFRDDQMASYGGRGSINKGICRKCSNDREKG